MECVHEGIQVKEEGWLVEPYHYAWMEVHPHLGVEWLEGKLREGFDIHHLDGDHGNNDPMNLVLIYCGDHMMLHNGSKRFSRVVGKRGGRKKRVVQGEPESGVDAVDWGWVNELYERERAIALGRA